MGAQLRRVLVADDSEDAADSTALVLRLAGFDVKVAYRGAGALQLATTFVPEVVILDINMPDLDGYEVAGALIAASAPNERPLLIALTALSRPEDVRRSMDAGFDHHVVKPATRDHLMSLINASARRSRREVDLDSGPVDTHRPAD